MSESMLRLKLRRTLAHDLDRKLEATTADLWQNCTISGKLYEFPFVPMRLQIIYVQAGMREFVSKVIVLDR